MFWGASFLLLSQKGDSDETVKQLVLGVGLAYKYRLPLLF